MQTNIPTDVLEKINDAIDHDDAQTLSHLVGEGLDPNLSTVGDRWNMLHLALVSVVRGPAVSVVKRLVDVGVDINGIDVDGWTPLHFAVRCKDNFAVAQLLIEHGAHVNATNTGGESPLSVALATGPLEKNVIELLVSAGADSKALVRGMPISDFLSKIGHGNNEWLANLFA